MLRRALTVYLDGMSCPDSLQSSEGLIGQHNLQEGRGPTSGPAPRIEKRALHIFRPHT